MPGMSTPTATNRAPEVIAPGSGHHLHFLNHLATVKVRGGDDGALSVVEFSAPRGLGPPLHRHDDEDELFVVLDGEVAFHCGDDVTLASEGAIAFLGSQFPDTVTLDAGQPLHLDNQDLSRHTFTVPDIDLDIDLPAGTAARADINLPTGTNTVICDIPGHELMTSQLTVG
jgi:hypothetical protein